MHCANETQETLLLLATKTSCQEKCTKFETRVDSFLDDDKPYIRKHFRDAIILIYNRSFHDAFIYNSQTILGKLAS